MTPRAGPNFPHAGRPEDLLRARDVAAILDLELETVVNHFQAGDLPGFRLWGKRGGPLRFRRSEIDAWLEERCRVADTIPGQENARATPQRPRARHSGGPPNATTE